MEPLPARQPEHGAGLTNLQYAPLAEITGRSPWLAPAALNCAAPDTGNMEVLARCSAPRSSSEQWLEPLLDGRDPLRVRDDRARRRLLRRHQHRHPDRTRRRRLRDQRPQVVDLRRDEPGLRDLHRDGQDRPGPPPGTASRHDPGPPGHPGRRRSSAGCGCSATTTAPTAATPRSSSTDVRVPAANLIGDEGDGFAIAQARLGPGRIHHCMRLDRHGRAGARADVQAGRPASSVRQAARRAGRHPGLDRRVPGPDRAAAAAGAEDGVADGHRRQPGGAHRDPGDQDRDPHHRANGSSTRRSRLTAPPASARTTPSPSWYAGIRTLRLADGPDEVHKASLARRELARHASVV